MVDALYDLSQEKIGWAKTIIAYEECHNRKSLVGAANIMLEAYRTEKARAEAAEAEVKALREALEEIARSGTVVGLANIFGDHPEETIDKYYAAYKYCMRQIERRMFIARAALEAKA